MYRTVNRGTSWVRIATNLANVCSCAVTPNNPNILYLTTRWEGMWYTTNALAPKPQFAAMTAYPFKYPVRLFFNPYNTNELWATSFGGGLMMCNLSTTIKDPVPDIEPVPDLIVSMAPNSFRIDH